MSWLLTRRSLLSHLFVIYGMKIRTSSPSHSINHQTDRRCAILRRFMGRKIQAAPALHSLYTLIATLRLQSLGQVAYRRRLRICFSSNQRLRRLIPWQSRYCPVIHLHNRRLNHRSTLQAPWMSHLIFLVATAAQASALLSVIVFPVIISTWPRNPHQAFRLNRLRNRTWRKQKWCQQRAWSNLQLCYKPSTLCRHLAVHFRLSSRNDSSIKLRSSSERVRLFFIFVGFFWTIIRI